jgi:hypothetical protein
MYVLKRLVEGLHFFLEAERQARKKEKGSG